MTGAIQVMTFMIRIRLSVPLPIQLLPLLPVTAVLADSVQEFIHQYEEYEDRENGGGSYVSQNGGPFWAILSHSVMLQMHASF